MLFHVLDGTEIKLTTTVLTEATVNAAQKFINLTHFSSLPENHWEEWQGTSMASSDLKPWGCICQHITGQRVTLAVLLTHQKKRRDTCKAVLSPLAASQPRSVVSEIRSGCWEGQWHSMAVSISSTLGLQMSPWKPPRALGSRKPGEALRNPLLDFSAARYFITGTILIASTIPQKSVGLFTPLHFGISVTTLLNLSLEGYFFFKLCVDLLPHIIVWQV